MRELVSVVVSVSEARVAEGSSGRGTYKTKREKEREKSTRDVIDARRDAIM